MGENVWRNIQNSLLDQGYSMNVVNMSEIIICHYFSWFGHWNTFLAFASSRLQWSADYCTISKCVKGLSLFFTWLQTNSFCNLANEGIWSWRFMDSTF